MKCIDRYLATNYVGPFRRRISNKNKHKKTKTTPATSMAPSSTISRRAATTRAVPRVAAPTNPNHMRVKPTGRCNRGMAMSNLRNSRHGCWRRTSNHSSSRKRSNSWKNMGSVSRRSSVSSRINPQYCSMRKNTNAISVASKPCTTC